MLAGLAEHAAKGPRPENAEGVTSRDAHFTYTTAFTPPVHTVYVPLTQAI